MSFIVTNIGAKISLSIMLIKAKKLGEYLPEQIYEIAALFAEAGHTAYLVGGAIRDILAGGQVVDYDWSTDATPEQIEEIFEESLPTGKSFGTITIKHKGHHYQVTTFRQESSYSDQRHPDNIAFSKDIREDILRRDFTINALAYNPLTKELVDECFGLEDLNNKLLRAVGNPRERFAEDGLRVLRAIRFLAHTGFAIELETGKALAALAPQWKELAAVERLYQELNKTLLCDNPDYGLSFLDWPAVNHLDRQVRWAAIIKEKPEVMDIILEKQKRRFIKKLLRYNLDLEKASLEIADLAIDGIDIMELGPRGEEVGKILDILLELVVERRAFNKKPKLLEFAKEIIAGADATELLENETRKRELAKERIL